MSAAFERAGARQVGPALQAMTSAAARRFELALEDPERAQRERLAAVLRAVSGSRQERGIAGFERIRRAREFQDAVPIRRPDDLARDVEDAARGVPAVLAREPVLRFERSGGSSGPSRLVPHTRALLDEFRAALSPWLHDLARARPRAWEGPGYWSVSPLAQETCATAGGIPIGGADDGAYFSAPMQRLLARGLAVPGAVARLPDVASCRYVTLRVLMQCPNLALASVWNPSFLTLLVEALDRDAERLIDDLAAGLCRPPAGRTGGTEESRAGSGRAGGEDAEAASEREIAARIARVVETLPLRADPVRAGALRNLMRHRGRLEPQDLWPHLALISTWTDAQAARSLPALRARFPNVEVQGKGLLATEGVVSIPWTAAPGPVLALRSHFLEFLDPEAPEARPRLAHELEPGRTYEVVMSTGAGFLRYRLGDLVRVIGHHRSTPCVRFEGRCDAVSDLVGEKLSALRVKVVLASVFASAVNGAASQPPPRFAMLAPEWGSHCVQIPGAPPAYRLYVESEASDGTLEAWAAGVDAALCVGFPYRYARSLGQLGPVRAVRVHDGARRYEARCVALGQRAGDVKPADLDSRTGWSEWMTGSVVRDPSVTVA